MDFLRTPDDRFSDLVDYPFSTNYATVSHGLRMHYLDEGPRDGRVVLLMHGEPSWSYLYRHMIPPLVAAGFRCIAPDLIGLGKSDKPTQQEDYTYARHIQWVTDLLNYLDLQNINLFCQDWGGLIALRILAAQPDRFATATASNTFLPTAEDPPSPAFMQWRKFSQEVPEFLVSGVLQMATTRDLSEAEMAAYDAPFPDETYKACVRVFPMLVPIYPSDPEAAANVRAWQQLANFDKPFLTLFGDSDPLLSGAERYFQKIIAGARGRGHAVIEGGHHFIQEDAADELCRRLIEFLGDA